MIPPVWLMVIIAYLAFASYQHNPTVILNSIQDPGLGMTGQMPDMPVALNRGFCVKHGMTVYGMNMI